MDRVESISQQSVQSTTDISASTQEQAAGVETVLNFMENVQTDVGRLAEVLNVEH